jgi:cytochrome bd ubiquinol oxidase subunit II
VATFWFTALWAMLVVYVVLDGADFGVGILHRFVARTDEERHAVLESIEPYWDGNEVWLLAAGGVVFFAFPRVYAAAFSGFYLALMIVLWLLILRGIAIAFRSQTENALWRDFWDTVFAVASVLMAFILGSTLGNLVRGVPVDEKGYFFVALFTDFRPGRHSGILDWYTVLVGIFALAVLAGHGALYLSWKTTGAVQARSRASVVPIWLVVGILWIGVTAATIWVRREIYANLMDRPWTIAFVVLLVAALVGVFSFRNRGRDRAAFLASSLCIAALLAATVVGVYPVLVYSSLDPAHNLTVGNAASGEHGLWIALAWWSFGITLVVGYFVYLFFKVETSEH